MAFTSVTHFNVSDPLTKLISTFFAVSMAPNAKSYLLHLTGFNRIMKDRVLLLHRKESRYKIEKKLI